jgi:hypothetical protein
LPRFSAFADALGISVAEQLSYVKSRHKNIACGDNSVALSLRDRKAEWSNNVDETFGIPVAERQGYFGARKQRLRG